jgi:hypothetical protein
MASNAVAEKQSVINGESRIDANPSIDFNKELAATDYAKDIDIEIKSSKPLTGKQYLLVIPITKYFKKLRNLYILINILNGRSVISLRLIEYFVVNYVLENNTYYNLNKYKNKPDYIVNNLFASLAPDVNSSMTSSDNSITRPNQVINEIKADISHPRTHAVKTPSNFDDFFMIHDNYKCQLKEYNKKNFDPFCRWTRIRLYYDKTKYFYTTVAQLNFFKWAIENYILDYILDNLPTIEKSMNDYEKAIKKEKRIRRINLQINTVDTGLESQGQCTTDLLNTSKLSPVESSSSNKHIYSTPCIGQPQKQTSTAKIVNNRLHPVNIDSGSSSVNTDSGSSSVNTDSVPFANIDLSHIIIDTDTVCTGSLADKIAPAATMIETNSLVKASQELATTQDYQLQQTRRKDPASIILLSTLDKKTKIKGRKKKEFTKTNRSILKYECTKIITFD